jgi:hypothetical protein
MKLCRLSICLTLLIGACGMPVLPIRASAQAAAALELYGNFNSMGVIVTLDAADDPDGDAAASLEYRFAGEASYRQGFPLTRAVDTRFVGSLFWLEPGSAYQVRVSFADPDGDPLDGIVLTGSGSTRAEIAIPPASHTYYASPSGSGTACSLAAPCSLEEGLNQAQPGEEVALRGGTYYQGDLSLPRSGATGAPIVIRSYAGETAILDGADPVDFAWTSQGNGIYHTTLNVADTFLVIANGERLLPYRSMADLQTLPWGVPGFYVDGVDLYVHLAGEADPNSAAMVVSRFSNAFTVEQDYIYFLDLTFRHYGVGDCCPKALYFYNASDNLVQGCTFAMNNLGIGIKYGSHRNVIQDNLFYDDLFAWAWDAFYAGEVPYGGGGIRFYSPADGRGTIIRRNVFHDFFDGFGACPDSTSAVTNETDVYENLVYNSGDDGMETDGRCSNVRIWGNTFHDVLMGISLAPVYDGPVYAMRNLIYRTGAGNNNYSGSAFKFNSGYDQSGPMYLFHNTGDAALTDPLSSGLDIKSPGSWTLITARNNIWSGTEFAISNANPAQPLDLDYDDLYTTQPGELAWWSDLPDRHLNTLAELQTATGQELHGMNYPPGFADAASGDYTLADSSPLIDAGLVIPGINDGFAGRAPDVGAFEYQGYGFTLSAEPPSQAIQPGEVAVYTLSLQAAGGFSDTVHLSASSPSPDLIVSLGAEQATPPAQVTLTVTDTHSASLPAGLWYTISISALSGEQTQSLDVYLLVDGKRLYLPMVLRVGSGFQDSLHSGEAGLISRWRIGIERGLIRR